MHKSRHWMTLGVLTLAIATQTSVSAQTYLPPGMYVGAFGGSGAITDTRIVQQGTAFSATPLAVDAKGNVSSHSTWFAGGNLGYAWKNPCWLFNPALEFEGYYLDTTLKGTLNARTVLDNRTFRDSLPVSAGVYLFNTVFNFNTPWSPCFHPYVGGGLGAATISVSNAKSTQITPLEAGINHFNAGPSAYENVFAAQVKAGLSYAFTKNVSIFGEYRYLYLGSMNMNFGSTSYTGHVPSSPWNMSSQGSNWNLGSLGIQFSA